MLRLNALRVPWPPDALVVAAEAVHDPEQPQRPSQHTRVCGIARASWQRVPAAQGGDMKWRTNSDDELDLSTLLMFGSVVVIVGYCVVAFVLTTIMPGTYVSFTDRPGELEALHALETPGGERVTFVETVRVSPFSDEGGSTTFTKFTSLDAASGARVAVEFVLGEMSHLGMIGDVVWFLSEREGLHGRDPLTGRVVVPESKAVPDPDVQRSLRRDVQHIQLAGDPPRIRLETKDGRTLLLSPPTGRLTDVSEKPNTVANSWRPERIRAAAQPRSLIRLDGDKRLRLRRGKIALGEEVFLQGVVLRDADTGREHRFEAPPGLWIAHHKQLRGEDGAGLLLSRVDVDTGAIRWTWDYPGPGGRNDAYMADIHRFETPQVTAGLLVVVRVHGQTDVVLLDPETGNLKWHKPFTPRCSWTLTTICDIFGTDG